MNRNDYITLLKDDEGYKDLVYLDTKGIPTCGWGHALHVGSSVPYMVSELFLEADLKRVDDDYELLKLYLDDVRANVVRCMLFQMGLNGVRKFKLFLIAMHQENWEEAKKQMLNSKWAREDSPKRAKRLANIVLTGVWPYYYLKND